MSFWLPLRHPLILLLGGVAVAAVAIAPVIWLGVG